MNIGQLSDTIIPLLKTHGVTHAGIFGSAARGEMDNHSDIDIIVDIGNEIGLLQFVGLQHLLEERLGRRVDLVEYQTLKPALKDKILRETVTLI